MDNNGNNGNNGNKAAGFLQKLLRYRLKVDRQGTPIVNVSSIFALACLIFAPHMSIAGIVISLLLGYHINLETDGDNQELEERLRRAAASVRTTASTVTKTIQSEIQKARSENQQARQAAPQQTARQPFMQQSAPTAPSTDEILKDLEKHADDFAESNPAATTFHSAYTASAGSVPTLRVEDTPAEPEVPTLKTMDSHNP